MVVAKHADILSLITKAELDLLVILTKAFYYNTYHLL